MPWGHRQALRASVRLTEVERGPTEVICDIEPEFWLPKGDVLLTLELASAASAASFSVSPWLPLPLKLDNLPSTFDHYGF